MHRLLFCILLFSINVLHLSAQDNRKIAAEKNLKAKESYNRVHIKSNRDSVAFYRSVVDAFNFTLESDKYDRMPNRKGKIKQSFAEENLKRASELYPMLIDAGIYLSKNDYTRSEGLSALKLYLNTRQNPLIAHLPDEIGTVAYYLSYYYLKMHDFKAADEYADLSMQYDETALEAAELKARCMQANMITEEDSVKYITVLAKLYETDPTNETYFSWIMKFYQNPTPRFNIESFIDRQLEEKYNSTIPWILKGEIAMHAKRWDEAIDAYKTADELDQSSIPVAYNIGVCLNMKGIEARNNVLEKKQKGEFVSNDEYKNIFAEARTYLERVKAKDPRRNKVDWVSPLYMVYTVLDDKIKAAELEPLVNKYKK